MYNCKTNSQDSLWGDFSGRFWTGMLTSSLATRALNQIVNGLRGLSVSGTSLLLLQLVRRGPPIVYGAKISRFMYCLLN